MLFINCTFFGQEKITDRLKSNLVELPVVEPKEVGLDEKSISPEKEMVVSITSSAYGLDYGQNRSLNIFKFILQATK